MVRARGSTPEACRSGGSREILISVLPEKARGFRRSYGSRAVAVDLGLGGPLRSGGGGGQDPQGAAHGCAAFSAGAGCPLGESRRLRGPDAQHRARRRGVFSLRQVSLHKQRKVARAITARKLLSSVAPQQPQPEPVVRIIPPLRNAQPRFGRQRNEAGVGVLVAVLDLHRLACIKVEAPPFDGHILRTAADQEGLDAAGLAQVRGAVLEGIEDRKSTRLNSSH